MHLSSAAAGFRPLLTQADVDSIVQNVANCIGEVFRAALNSAINFQVRKGRLLPYVGADIMSKTDAAKCL